MKNILIIFLFCLYGAIIIIPVLMIANFEIHLNAKNERLIDFWVTPMAYLEDKLK